MSLSDGDDDAPSQWIPLKESAPSAPRRSEARPSFSMDSMFISMFESDEFDVSTNSNGNIETDDASSKMKAKLAAKETSAVKCLKFILLTVLLLASCAFAAVVYTSTNNDETEKFEDTFAVYSQQIEDSVQMSAQNRLEAIGALAFQMQVHAFNANETWPFVTVPFFEDQIFAMKTLTDAFGVLLFPIVSQKDRSDWEKYSIANRHWVNKSYAAQEHKLGKSGEVLPANDETWFDVLWGQGFENPQNPDFSSGIGDRIFGGWDPNNDTIRGPFVYPKRELYFPQWQAAPLSWYSQSTVNQNYAQFEDFYNSTILSMETGHAIMGFAWFDNIVPGNITTMLYPIYRDIYPEDEDGASDVVAFLGVDIYWRDYLTDIFNDDDAGATVVIENNVNQTFTYKIIGESVTFLGEGDLHCKEYDEMVHSFVFGSNLAPSADNQELTYSGAFLHQEWVQYTFRIYPSKDLEENFHSTRPIVYTVVVLLVAIIAAGTFFLYDFVVERRQRIILRTAERSDAIVSSLFPKNVKEQLYLANVADSGAGNDQKHPATKSNKKEEGNGTTLTADSDVSERPQSEKAQGRVSNNSLEGAVADLRTPGIRKLEGPPIAEHYEEATVFFAGT